MQMQEKNYGEGQWFTCQTIYVPYHLPQNSTLFTGCDMKHLEQNISQFSISNDEDRFFFSLTVNFFEASGIRELICRDIMLS